MTSNDDIKHALGRLEGIKESVAQLSEEKESAHESRSVIHRRLDEQGKQINLLDKAVEINAGVDAQVRDELKSIKRRFRKVMTPSNRRWRSGKVSKLSAMGFQD